MKNGIASSANWEDVSQSFGACDAIASWPKNMIVSSDDSPSATAPSGSTSCGIHTGIGRSSASIPISRIFDM